jgi:hypothetical protein
VHLRRFGLVDDDRIFSSFVISTSEPISVTNILNETCDALPSFQDDPMGVENGWSSHISTSRESENDSDDLVDDVIAAMKEDLKEVEDLNGRRVAFLEKIARFSSRSIQDKQQRSEREASLIAKCQLLLRKAKELKAKSGLANRKDDSLALPW